MVSFPDAVKMFFARYTDFKGRSRRSEYWWVQLALFLFFFVFSFVGGLIVGLLGGIDAQTGEPGPLYWAFMGLLGIAYLAILIPIIALTVRRLHDVNITGWLMIGALIPLVNFLVGLAIFVISLIPGTVGPNKYGPDPKNPGAGAADAFV